MADPLDPRSIRTNNPGAMNYGPFAQRWGATGTDGRLAVFPDMQSGFNAMGGLLDTYRDKHGLDTVAGIVGRWAPRGVDNNSTDTYTATVARKLGIDPNDPVPAHMRPALMEAMASYEAGRPVSMGGAQPQQQPQQQGPRMASPFEQQKPEPGMLDSLVQRFNSPMTQQGFGLLLSAMQGGDLNKGMSAGAERGQMSLQQQMAARKEREEDERKRAVAQMLQDPNSMQGVPQGLVNIARATQNVDPISQYYAKQGGTDDIREYEYAIRSGFKGDFTSWMNQKRAHAGGEYAKQLVYGTDAKGNVVPMQAGSRGDLVASKMPEGVQMQRDPIKFDAGTHFVLMDPTTRQPIGMVPKNLSGVEIEKGAGETIAKARTGLPQAEQTFQDTVQLLDKMRAHPGLPYSVGAPSYIPPIHGTSVRDFVSMFDQAKGGAFLQAAQKMRGLGALTETEGAAATKAIARMDRSQSQAAFLDALKDYQHIMDRGLATMRAQAQIGQQPQAPATAPASPAGWGIMKVQ